MEKTVSSGTLQQKHHVRDNEAVGSRLVLNEAADEIKTISGTAADIKNGNPIEGVCLQLLDSEYKPILHGFTDSRGKFRLEGSLSHSVRLMAGKKGYITYSSELLPVGFLTSSQPSIELKSLDSNSAVIMGSVMDFRRAPLANIRITLLKAASAAPASIAYSNEGGLFAFDGVEYGVYRILYQSLHCQERSEYLEVLRGAGVISMEPVFLRRKNLKGTLTGIISDSTGQPVDNALVLLLNSNNKPVDVTHTNEQGVYFFYKLEADNYSIMVKA